VLEVTRPHEVEHDADGVPLRLRKGTHGKVKLEQRGGAQRFVQNCADTCSKRVIVHPTRREVGERLILVIGIEGRAVRLVLPLPRHQFSDSLIVLVVGKHELGIAAVLLIAIFVVVVIASTHQQVRHSRLLP